LPSERRTAEFGILDFMAAERKKKKGSNSDVLAIGIETDSLKTRHAHLMSYLKYLLTSSSPLAHRSRIDEDRRERSTMTMTPADGPTPTDDGSDDSFHPYTRQSKHPEITATI
jgi:hypothetical protein